MMNTAEIARKALEVLDRDGWCKMALTWPGAGTHCIAGAANIAMHDTSDWAYDEDEFYDEAARIIRIQYPEYKDDCTEFPGEVLVVEWNNSPGITEADVRAVLEKMAAG
jgi:hypothetical protein